MNNGDMPANSTSLEISERYEDGHYDQVALGLTKREHFAGLAMQSLLLDKLFADMSAGQAAKLLGINEDEYRGKTDFPKLIGKFSIRYADALLAALEAE